MTAASPLCGPKSMKEAASPPLIFRARRAGYGAASPASRALRVSCGNGLRPPLTPETSAAPGAGRAGRRRACPGQARGAQGRSGGRLRVPGRQGANELAFDNQKKRRKNYTNAGPGTGSGSLITAEPPGEAASHRTRCAWNSGCSTGSTRRGVSERDACDIRRSGAVASLRQRQGDRGITGRSERHDLPRLLRRPPLMHEMSALPERMSMHCWAYALVILALHSAGRHCPPPGPAAWRHGPPSSGSPPGNSAR